MKRFDFFPPVKFSSNKFTENPFCGHPNQWPPEPATRLQIVSNQARLHDLNSLLYRTWAGIPQPVQRLATGWTVRGSNPGGGRDFPHPFKPALGLTQPPIQWVPGLFPGGKAAGSWRRPPTPHLPLKLKKQ